MKQAITIIVVFLLGIGVGIGVDKYVLKDGGEKYTAVTIEDSVKDIAELAVLENDYTDQENWDGEAKQILGKDIPFTSKSVQLVYSGVIKAGPDMNKVKADVNGKTINVVLPHSKILSHEINEDSIVLVNVKNGIFNRVTPDNMNEVRKKAKESKEKRILESDFLDQADEKAVNQVETFLKSAYADAEVNVKVDSVS